MKIKIEKKGERYILFFSDDEKEIKGIFLNYSELKRLSSTLEEVIEYGNERAGDDI